jgi:hypothetical protein
MPVLDLGGRLRRNDPTTPLYIQSIMFYPSDPKSQVRYQHDVLGRAVKEAILSTEEAVPNALITMSYESRLDEHLDRLRGESARSRAKSGESYRMSNFIIAGWLLLVPIVALVMHKRSIGRNGAYEIVGKDLSNRDMQGSSRRHLEGIWRRYESVSHLWAAMILSGTPPPFKKDGLIKFLNVAEGLRKIGENHIPIRAASPLLNREIMWTVPPDFPLSISVSFRNVGFNGEAKKLIDKAPAAELPSDIWDVVVASAVLSDPSSH